MNEIDFDLTDIGFSFVQTAETDPNGALERSRQAAEESRKEVDAKFIDELKGILMGKTDDVKLSQDEPIEDKSSEDQALEDKLREYAMRKPDDDKTTEITPVKGVAISIRERLFLQEDQVNVVMFTPDNKLAKIDKSADVASIYDLRRMMSGEANNRQVILINFPERINTLEAAVSINREIDDYPGWEVVKMPSKKDNSPLKRVMCLARK